MRTRESARTIASVVGILEQLHAYLPLLLQPAATSLQEDLSRLAFFYLPALDSEIRRHWMPHDWMYHRRLLGLRSRPDLSAFSSALVGPLSCSRDGRAR